MLYSHAVGIVMCHLFTEIVSVASCICVFSLSAVECAPSSMCVSVELRAVGCSWLGAYGRLRAAGCVLDCVWLAVVLGVRLVGRMAPQAAQRHSQCGMHLPAR